jgi:hypothetical protein
MPRAQKDVYDLSFGVIECMNLRIGTSTACSNVLIVSAFHPTEGMLVDSATR